MITTELAFERVGVASIKTDRQCSACGKIDAPVLAVDTSDQEYGYIYICKKCIDNEFEQAELKKFVVK